MIKYTGYAIAFQEVPDEISLTFNVSNCPHFCEGCHSPYLRGDIGKDLERDLPPLLKEYSDLCSCVCFMGEGNDIDALVRCIKTAKQEGYKVALYSGSDDISIAAVINSLLGFCLDYVKIGSYKASLGGLNCRSTNQKMLRFSNNKYEDITYKFWKNKE